MTHDRVRVRRSSTSDHRELSVDASVDVVAVVMVQRFPAYQAPKVGVSQSEFAQHATPYRSPRREPQPLPHHILKPIHRRILPAPTPPRTVLPLPVEKRL